MPPWTGSRRNRHAALWTLTARVALARFRHGLCERRREADADDPRLAGRRFMARQAMITVRHVPADNAGETIAHNVESHPALAEQHLPRRCRERRRAGVPARHRLDAAKAARHRTTGIAGLGRSIRGGATHAREHSLRDATRRRPALGSREFSRLKPIQRQSSLQGTVTATPVWQGASRLRDSSGGKGRLHALPGIPAPPAGLSNCSLVAPSRSPCG